MKKLSVVLLVVVVFLAVINTKKSYSQLKINNNVKIVLEDGSLYEMKSGELAMWQYFIENNSKANELIEDVLIVISKTNLYGAKFVASISVKQKYVSVPTKFDDYIWDEKKKVDMNHIVEVISEMVR